MGAEKKKWVPGGTHFCFFFYFFFRHPFFGCLKKKMGLFFKKHPKNGCFFFWHPFFGCFLKKAPISSKTTFFSLQPLILILRTSHFKYEIGKTFFRPLLFLFCPTTISIVQTTVTQNGCQKWVPKNGCQKWVPVLERLLLLK